MGTAIPMENTGSTRDPRMFEKLAKVSTATIIFSLVLLTVFTPVVFGAVQPWSIFVFESAICLMACAWFARISFEKWIAVNRSVLYLPVILFTLMVLLQMFPFPQTFIKFFSPAAFEIRRSAVDILRQTGFSQYPAYFSLSLNAVPGKFLYD